MKEGLVKDASRHLRFKPEIEKFSELNEELNAKNIPLKIYQIDLEDGVSSDNRKEIFINIKRVLN